MFVFFITIFGIAIYGGKFVRFQILHIPITYIVMAALFVSYIRYFIVNKGILKLTNGEKKLTAFEIYGGIMTVLSLLGLNTFFTSDDLYRSAAYIPRQVYYLLFLPAIILFRDSFYTEKVDRLLARCGKILFWLIYFGHITAARKFSLSVPTEFILGWLALSIGKGRATKSSILMLIATLFTPLAVGGEMTNLLIRFVYAAHFFFYKKQGKRLFQLMAMGAGISVIAIFVLPLFDKVFSFVFDANSLWRLRYWKDEMIELSKSFFLGVGYGTSYASKNFVGESLNIVGGPFGATSEYSTFDKLFITGPHSSFVSVAFRLGIIGLVNFVLFIKGIYRDLLSSGREISPATCFAFFGAIIIIGVNVGLESPYYLMMFVFALGRCVQDAKSIPNSNISKNRDGIQAAGVLFHTKQYRKRGIGI